MKGGKFTAGEETDIDRYRESDSSQFMNAIAQHLWFRNLEYEETPFMEIPGPHFHTMMQHMSSAMKESGLVVSGDVLMLLFGFVLSESMALRRPTPSLLLDTIFYMKEQDMVDIDEWIGIPWEWMLHMKRVLKSNSYFAMVQVRVLLREVVMLQATEAPVSNPNISILDQHYDEGRPSIQAVRCMIQSDSTLQVSIDAELKWKMMLNNFGK